MDSVLSRLRLEIQNISFAISDENGLPRVYRRYGEALVLSITLVPGKAYPLTIFMSLILSLLLQQMSIL